MTSEYHRRIWERGSYRVIEHVDSDYILDNLKGDLCTTPLEHEAFEAMVTLVGVFGYELQKWNPDVGCGWEHVDSCWGFIGEYCESNQKFNHYIVLEFIARAAAMERVSGIAE